MYMSFTTWMRRFLHELPHALNTDLHSKNTKHMFLKHCSEVEKL
jgi:hypothetical protein